MKIKHMNISEYGCILKKDIDFGDEISVIKGNNESGKSTTHQAILALMFGYLNAGRKKSFTLSPKAKAFTGGYPKIEGDCTDRFGEYKVSRYFDGETPKVSVSKGGVILESGNEPLDLFKGISRETYEGIYSLDIEQIVALKESWEREQDSILGGLYPDFLLSHEKIVENLDKKIKEAWKGKILTKLTKAKEIEDAILEQKNKIKQAKRDQQELRSLEIEGEETEEKITSCAQSIDSLSKEGIELKRQLSFYKEYSEINNTLIETNQLEKYKDVPRDTKHHLEEIVYEINSQKEKINQKEKRQQQLRETANDYQSKYKTIMHYKQLVPKAENITSNLEGLKASAARDLDREKTKRNQIGMKIKRLFTNSFTWDDFAELMKINIAECFALLDNLQRFNEEKAKLSQKVIESTKVEKKSFLEKLDRTDYLLFGAGFIGFLMIFVPLGINRAVAVILGALLLAGAAVGEYLKRPKQTEEVKEDETTLELRRLDTEYNKVMSRLIGMLNYGFIPYEKRNHPDKSLIESIAQLQDDYVEYTQLRNEVEQDKVDTIRKEDEVKRIAVEVIGRSTRYEADTADMRRKLDALLKLESDAIAAQKEISMLDEQIKELKENIAEGEEKIRHIDDVLHTMEGANIIIKADRLKKMRQDYQSAKSRQSVLKQKYEDYDELENNIENNLDAKIFDINTTIEKNIQLLDEKRKELQELNSRKGELKSKMNYLKDNSESPAIIEGIIENLREEKQKRIQLRDEYAICYGIIQKARDKFVSDFNPKFLDKASRYLSLITEGRYNKISLNEKGTSIMVMEDSSRVFDFESIDTIISRGTREQIYLALRLAMLERFDPQDDKLPIVLDEALVNWDVVRFAKLMQIVNDIAKERQVFMFTCHDYVVDVVSQINDNFRLINI